MDSAGAHDVITAAKRLKISSLTSVSNYMEELIAAGQDLTGMYSLLEWVPLPFRSWKKHGLKAAVLQSTDLPLINSLPMCGKSLSRIFDRLGNHQCRLTSAE